MQLPKAQLGMACSTLGNPQRALSFNTQGSSSWALQDQLSRTGRVQVSYASLHVAVHVVAAVSRVLTEYDIFSTNVGITTTSL